MKELMGVITAMATAVAAIAKCSVEAQPTTPPVSGGVVIPSPAAPPVAPPNPPSASSGVSDASAPRVPISPALPGDVIQQPLTASKDIIERAIYCGDELKKTGLSPVPGDNGVSAEMRKADARKKVELSSFIAQNIELLEGLVARNPELEAAISEGKKLRYYEAELAKLERRP
jgi:hypothetical protein